MCILLLACILFQGLVHDASEGPTPPPPSDKIHLINIVVHSADVA